MGQTGRNKGIAMTTTMKGRIRKGIWIPVFLFPAMLLFLACVILPLFQGIPYSLMDWNGVSPTHRYVGLKNYVKLLSSTELWRDVATTFRYTFAYMIAANVLGLATALLLRKGSRLNNLCRTLIFMPYVISMITAAFVWKSIFNEIYSPLFLVPSPLGVPDQALMGIVAISVWRVSGYCMLIYIAALQSIPVEYYEAAKVEGASGLAQFLHITAPMIVPAFSTNVTLLLAWGFKVFDTVMAATGGGPGKATETMSMYVYNNIFGYMKAGYGQAAAIMMTVILLVISIFVSRFFRTRVVEA